MTKKIVFICDYCGLEFDNQSDCKEHEEIHNEDFSKKSNKEISDRLFHLYSFCSEDRFGSKVMGMPIDNFSSLMREAAQRLRKVEDE